MKRLRLIQLNQRGLGNIHYLTKPKVTLGRASTNDIVINHKQVSRNHLLIRVASDGTSGTVEDCGSANGAFLNGDLIEKAVELSEGATLTIGDIDFLVELMDADKDKDFAITESRSELQGTVDVDDYTSDVSTARNDELDDLGLRNFQPDLAFDEIAEIAAAIFAAPRGFVSVIDEQDCFYKGAFGISKRRWKRSETPCTIVVDAHAPIWVGEIYPDERTLALPFLANDPVSRFYAATPFTGPSGIVIGTIGVSCPMKKTASEVQLKALSNLAHSVERLVTLTLEKRRADQLHLRMVEEEDLSDC